MRGPCTHGEADLSADSATGVPLGGWHHEPEEHGHVDLVTRGELREEIELLDQRFKQWLEIWAGALITRIDGVERRIAATGRKLSEELARHTSAILESMTTQIA